MLGVLKGYASISFLYVVGRMYLMTYEIMECFILFTVIIVLYL